MQADTSRKLMDEFLSNLRSILGKKRFKFDLKLIKRHSHLYRLETKHKTLFLFIHVVHQGKDFFRIPSPWEEISHFVSSLEDINWGFILLKKPEDRSGVSGFQIPCHEFMRLKSSFTMDRTGLIKIKQKDLAPEYEFNSWDTFFQMLNLCPAACTSRSGEDTSKARPSPSIDPFDIQKTSC
jgi:hypothetical protein